MGAAVEALIALQDIELQIVDIRRQLTAKQRSVTRQATKLREAEQHLAAAQAEVRHAQMEVDAVDVDLKARQSHLARLRDNLNTVRTNKEYAAVLSQLNSEKADANRLEARAFELLAQAEAKRKSLGELEHAVQEERARLENLKRQWEQAQGSFNDRLRALERQREEAAERVGAKALDLFNRISERYDGEVMARVVQVHPRRQEFICDGCNMSLAIERANALMTRDDVLTCDNCGRILFIDLRA